MSGQKKYKYCSVIIIIVAALGLLFLCGRKGNMPSQEGNTKIMVATDLHYLAQDLNDKGEYFMNMVENSDGKTTEYCKEIMEALVRSALRENPDVLILSGDLTFNGEKKSHEELAGILKKISDAGIPVLVLPGNHDLFSERAYAFSGKYIYGVANTNEDEFQKIYRNFGLADAIFKDESSLSYTYKINNSLWVLMVDTNTKGYPGGVSEQTLSFVEKVLINAKNSGVGVISITHQNLLKHHPDIYKNYVIEGAERLFSLYKEYGCTLNLSGHMHMQHINQVENITEIVTSSIMLYPLRYGILEINDDKITYNTDSVCTEEDTIMDRARNLLVKPIYDRVLEEVPDENVARWFAEANLYYFTGRPDLIEWDSTIYEKVFPRDGRTERYFKRMGEEPKMDYTKWESRSRNALFSQMLSFLKREN